MSNFGQTPPTIDQIEDQKRFEADCISEGVRRYRRALAEGGLTDAPPGRLAQNEMLRTLIPAIEAAKAEALEGIATSGPGPRRRWWWMVHHLDAPRLALITARALITFTTREVQQSRIGVPVTPMAFHIARAVKLEMEFDNWRDQSRENAKEPPHIDIAKLIVERAGGADARSFARWKRKLKNIGTLDWDKSIKIALGTKLIELAVEYGGGWFELSGLTTQGVRRPTLCVRPTEAALEAIADINARLEVNAPFFMPMICPPKPWRKECDTT